MSISTTKLANQNLHDQAGTSIFIQPSWLIKTNYQLLEYLAVDFRQRLAKFLLFSSKCDGL